MLLFIINLYCTRLRDLLRVYKSICIMSCFLISSCYSFVNDLSTDHCLCVIVITISPVEILLCVKMCRSEVNHCKLFINHFHLLSVINNYFSVVTVFTLTYRLTNCNGTCI